TKNIGYMAVRNYVNECRRLYFIMYQRGECSPNELTRWHFEETLHILDRMNYKNLYDSAANLKDIAEIIDKKEITEFPVCFKHREKPRRNHFDYKAHSELDDKKRREEEKL